ncbi:phage host-nuclease inhibitor protein Gam [Neobacillus niacini]|uniref:hypothetical protein n=1 Tax=Neobacillus driksii TaxID=3035913 RepID=UPI0027818AE5|nr:hypothetical protein [Neobacillus niacini]MDQ0976641.1 phage host-nuclease inhibitor protein Gam [Neobacillus niacini]
MKKTITGLKEEIKAYVEANREDLQTNFLTKVTIQFKEELTILYKQRTHYDKVVAYITELKHSQK